MNYLEQVQQGIDYIESSLDDELSLQKVSTHAGLSQWHFQRIFKALTNETLKTYIRSRRLANALDKLTDTEERIIDIALLAGFESQESFSRAFKKAYAMTPKQARDRDGRNFLYRKVEFNQDYLRHINQNLSLTPEIFTQSAQIFIGLKTTFYSVDSEKNNIADKLPALWDEFLPRMGEIEGAFENLAYGIVRQTEDKTDLLEYYAVCEVTELISVPEGMVVVEIPATRYAKFTHQGDVKLLNNTVNYIYSSWLLQSNRQHTLAADIEAYAEDYVPDSDDSIIHYSIPIV